MASALSPSSERKCGEGRGEGAPDMGALGGGGRRSGKCVLEQRGHGAAASSHGMWGLVGTVGKLAVTLHKIITCAGLQ